jgi:hypothetical protein
MRTKYFFVILHSKVSMLREYKNTNSQKIPQKKKMKNPFRRYKLNISHSKCSHKYVQNYSLTFSASDSLLITDHKLERDELLTTASTGYTIINKNILASSFRVNLF